MPAAEQMAHLTDFFTGIAWWTLIPAPHLLLHQPGEEDVHHHILLSASADYNVIVAYTPAGKEIVLSDASGAEHIATWLDPRTGARQAASAQEGETGRTFRTADSQDWLLVLTRA
jgi:hypothetical protein